MLMFLLRLKSRICDTTLPTKDHNKPAYSHSLSTIKRDDYLELAPDFQRTISSMNHATDCLASPAGQ